MQPLRRLSSRALATALLLPIIASVLPLGALISGPAPSFAQGAPNASDLCTLIPTAPPRTLVNRSEPRNALCQANFSTTRTSDTQLVVRTEGSTAGATKVVADLLAANGNAGAARRVTGVGDEAWELPGYFAAASSIYFVHRSGPYVVLIFWRPAGEQDPRPGSVDETMRFLRTATQERIVALASPPPPAATTARSTPAATALSTAGAERALQDALRGIENSRMTDWILDESPWISATRPMRRRATCSGHSPRGPSRH